jgi:hypothetical protein
MTEHVDLPSPPVPTPILTAGPALPPTFDHAAAATQRAKACWEEVNASLAQHRCRLQPALDVRPAGQDGSAAMVSATVVIVPQP